MPEFIERMKEKIDRSKLRVVDGELRDGPAGPLTGNALATRLHIKQLNKHAQNMLIRFAEPMAAIAAMAIISDSLTEYEVLDNQKRTVALSLLRSVRNWICTEMRVGSGFPSQKGGQCLGQHKIRYGIMPHQGNWQDVNIPLAGDFFNAALRPVQTGRHACGVFAKQNSLFEIANPLLRFSAIKRAEDGNSFVVRLYHPTSRKQKNDLKFAAELCNAWVTNLNEEREHKLSVKGNTISITVEPHIIVTLAIEPQHGMA